MELVPPELVLRGSRCPCVCGGEGRLVFEACPGCEHVLLVCDEVGTAFSTADLATSLERGARCPGCGREPLERFTAATSAQVERSPLALAPRA